VQLKSPNHFYSLKEKDSAPLKNIRGPLFKRFTSAFNLTSIRYNTKL
jgi:hypothetical protein